MMTKPGTPTEQVEQPAAAAPAAAPSEDNISRHDPAALRQQREALNVSRAALSELTGLPVSRVWAAEQPTKEVTIEHFQIISAALENVSEHGLPDHLKPKPTRRGDRVVLAEVALMLVGALDSKTMKDMRVMVQAAHEKLLEHNAQREADRAEKPEPTA